MITRSNNNKTDIAPTVTSSASTLREKAARLRSGIERHYLECAGFAAVLPVVLVIGPAMFKVSL